MIKLNIGCGPNVFPFAGWTNYDHEDVTPYFVDMRLCADSQLPSMPPQQVRLVKFLRTHDANFHVADLRRGFPQYVDGSVDLIYFGQVIEHLNPVYETPKVLAELRRLLKPGGVLRITTPDLDLLLDAYARNQMSRFTRDQPAFYARACPALQLAYIMYGACGPKCTSDHYEGHMVLFNRESMRAALVAAGFKPDKIVFYGESGESLDNTMSIECFDAGMSHSFITEAAK